MDRNAIIGMLLIATLLLAYFTYFSPSPTPPPTEEGIQEVKGSNDSPLRIEEDRAPTTKPMQPPDSTVAQDGLLALRQGEATTMRIANDDIALELSSYGGVITQVLLKKFKAYGQKPLYLIQDGSSSFSLLAHYQKEVVDLYALHYKASSYQKGDSTVVEFVGLSSDGVSIKQVYTLPPTGYQVKYNIETRGMEDSDLLVFNWHDRVILQEQHMQGSRNKTTINYYTTSGDFDGLAEASTDPETEAIAEPIKWVAMKQKFFISALIADHAFTGGEIASALKASNQDTSTVKDLQARLFVKKQDLTRQGSGFAYFFGPIEYALLSKTAPDFSKNLNLGWPPILWVNQFVIIPIFQFLERYISNYGIIIIILVLIIKLILSPLSYKSYLGMAKMRLLKPELDLLKEKYKGDMSKVQQEQLKLYQQAGVNPFSGCIPLVLQMPILFAMFYFFPSSIELRQSGFLWAHDLSTYDSVLKLPFTIPFYGNHVSLFVLLMTVSTIVYTWQNNQISSAQGPMKMMSYMMPVVFIFVLNSFSAGLSLYYLVANLVTFGQQAIIRQFVDEEKIKAVMDKHKKKIMSGKGGKRSQLINRLQESIKAREEQKKK